MEKFWYLDLSLAGDSTPVYTAAQERKKRTCGKGVRDCQCGRYYSSGWDSHQECYYFDYVLYMLTDAGSENNLPVFPFLAPASRHDSIGFLYNWFSMQQFLPEANVTKLLLDSAQDAIRRDGTESAKGRTVHLVIKDNPRLFNDPPHGSREWK